MADPRLRQFTIKTGVLKRITKEKLVTDKEVVQQQNRIEKLRAEGKDFHVMRKEDEILQESLMMVPDCQRRLAKAFTELNEMLQSEIELKETKEYEAAVAILEDAKLQMD